ncbi:MAG: flagellar motor switch protein FliN [Treponema sp.]|nr:flagellar motor switch protein FliN [Treponema sp.]MCL2251678.1 flagellar motor switch protein FliN [Treponema sp.]
MSDGALSQDEIDALLSGVDSSSMSGLGGGSPAATMTAPSAPPSFDRMVLEKFFASTTNALSNNLAALTGSSVTLVGPKVAAFSRDSFLSQLPDMVTTITANYNSGFPGEHIFILPEVSAKAIASLMTKEDNIQLDEMAMSVIGEVVSQMVGTQITALTSETGNKSIAAASPNAVNVRKATAPLPAGDFAVMSYNLDLGDGQSHQMWEILGSSPATDISNGLSGKSQAVPAGAGMGAQNMGQGMGQNMGMGMGMPMGGMGMGNMGMGMGMPMGGMGMGMPMGGMGMSNMGPTNVQQVQFPNLMQPRLGPHEAGNIGLIMDVSMEMTVELGRTRKLIKEILGMGEGTIIELDKLAGEPVDILVNHKLIAKGEVVVIDENFGVRVTEIVSPMERINDMGYN